LRKARATHRRNLEEAETEARAKRLSKLRDPKLLAKLCKGPKAKAASLIKKDGETLGPLDSLKELISSHCKKSEEEKDPYEDKKNIKVTTAYAAEQIHFVTPTLLKRAFAGFQVGKSPGPDEITPFILKHLTPNMLDRLCCIMRHTGRYH
jgi:hypothetical protein